MSAPQKSSMCGPRSRSATVTEEEVCWPISIGQPAAVGGLVVPEMTSDGMDAL